MRAMEGGRGQEMAASASVEGAERAEKVEEESELGESGTRAGTTMGAFILRRRDSARARVGR